MTNIERRRVSVFLPALEGGGAERAMLKLASGIQQRGFRVDLVVANAFGAYVSCVPEGVRVVDLRRRGVLAALPALTRYLRNERPAAIVSALNHANLVAVWARRLAALPAPLALSVQNNVSSKFLGNSVSLRERAVAAMVRRFFPWSDAITCVSEGVADDLAGSCRLPRNRILVIHNPIVSADLARLAAEPAEHPWFGDEGPAPVVAVGALHPQKDFPTLLRAFRIVRQRRPARLVILGEGQQRAALEALVSELGLDDCVSLPGFVDNPYAHMARASLFVLSSIYEGLPTVLIEAMAVGVAVVATDCPSGPQEILEGGRWGPLIRCGDVEGLADAIDATLEERRGGVDAEAVAAYSIDTVVPRYLGVLGLPHREAGAA